MSIEPDSSDGGCGRGWGVLCEELKVLGPGRTRPFPKWGLAKKKKSLAVSPVDTTAEFQPTRHQEVLSVRA